MAVTRPTGYRPQLTSRSGLEALRFCPFESNANLRAGQFGIQRIIYDLLHYDPATIKVFNVDLYSRTERYRSGHYDSSAYPLPSGRDSNVFVHIVHDLRSDFISTQRLARTGAVDFDSHASQILAQTLDVYTEKLEAAGPL